MKKIFSAVPAVVCLAALALSSCMNEDKESPELDPVAASITSPVSVGETNMTIARLKDDNSALFSETNKWKSIDEDIVIEGVVCANDVSGNLYQTVLLRDIDHEAGTDQCLVLAVRNTCLYPHFQLGQRVKVNLKGLCIGCYSKVPKIGQPYITSSGNPRLGPILLELCRTNVELVGRPNPSAPELIPVVPDDDWLRASANRTYRNTPMLATVTGNIVQVNEANRDKAETGEITGEVEPLPKVFGPRVLRDLGYGVDRDIQLQSNTSKVTLRTGTSNEVSYARIPTDVRSFTGMLTYYSSWQLQLRSLDDIYPGLEKTTYENQ